MICGVTAPHRRLPARRDVSSRLARSPNALRRNGPAYDIVRLWMRLVNWRCPLAYVPG